MKRKPIFIKDRQERMQDRDIITKRAERMQRREERKQTFGDSFREQRKDERRSLREMDEESLDQRRIFRKIRTRADRPEE